MTENKTGLAPKVLPIITYPNDILRKVADKVTEFDDELSKLVINMIATTISHEGVGLAGPQVGINKRIIVVVLGENPLALINPFIIKTSESKVIAKEGCLSVPGYYDNIERPEEITVSYQTANGEDKESTAGGLLAVIVQHEIDHLNGKMFVDYLSPFKQKRAKDKTKKTIKKLRKLGKQLI
jgi:peptide deformylase